LFWSVSNFNQIQSCPKLKLAEFKFRLPLNLANVVINQYLYFNLSKILSFHQDIFPVIHKGLQF